MRKFYWIVASLYLASIPAIGEIGNVEGGAAVDPIYGSADALVTITGPAALALYNLLEGSGRIRRGPGITCKERIRIGKIDPSVPPAYECAMKVSAQGEVAAFGE
jgi:hypothetical protein